LKILEILLIDADSKIPNLALMKLSTWYKSKGHNVTLQRLNIPYYPDKQTIQYSILPGYDKVYCSVIFTGTKDMIIDNTLFGCSVIYGGTGHDLTTKLPPEIDRLDPDYSIYPDNNESFGFISRGCNRKCYFCVVPLTEGKVYQQSTIDQIVKHDKVNFLDNNILQLKNHNEILRELIDKNINCHFNQGLDIRMIEPVNADLLRRLRYHKEYIFAFDDIKYKSVIEKKLALLDWRNDWQFKFYVYVHPDMKISETVERVEYLRGKKCLSYVMRDLSCFKSPKKSFYNTYSAYCNQPGFFKNMSFEQFTKKRHTSKRKIENIIKIYSQ